MKVLISAYSCEPGKGSERGVGWNIVIEMAKYHEVWVLTRPDESREAIEAELQQHPNANLHFIYFTLPFWQNSLRWGQSGAMQLHYYLWQIQAYFVACKLYRDIKFDLAHHVTFVRYSCPSFLVFLPIPLIWGPVGGGESAPKAFGVDFHLRNKIYEFLRGTWRFIGECDPFTRLTARRSALIFATTKDTATRLKQLGATNIASDSEQAIGISDLEISRLSHCPPPSTSPIRFVNIARLLHWKGIHLGLKAFAQAKLPNAEYWVIGEGSELYRLQTLCDDLGITEKVTFFNALPREDVLVKLGQSSVLVHPSLHDSGGFVLLEAMATGRPILCLDLGGSAELVSPDVGIKVAAINPEQVVQDLAAAMIRFAQNPDLFQQMGDSGRQKVKGQYSWEAKGLRLSQIYDKVVCNYSCKGHPLNASLGK